MASGQPSVAEYFCKGDANKSSEKKQGDSNPSKRTRSELSSTASEVGDPISHQILDDLAEIKAELRKSVKSDELSKVVKETVTLMMKEMKTEFEKKLSDQKAEYDKKLLDVKIENDKLGLANNTLKEKLHERGSEIRQLEKRVKEAQKIASKARIQANRNEQYSRKTNVKLHGVDDVKLPDGTVQGTEERVRSLLEEKLEVKVDSKDIVACHRIPAGKGTTIRPILLKVRNTAVKSTIMRNRKAFRGLKKGYKLTDDITKDNAELIRELLKHESVEQAWLFNCNVYAKITGLKEQRVMFEITDDIKKKINKKLSGDKGRQDPNAGYETDSDSESEA